MSPWKLNLRGLEHFLYRLQVKSDQKATILLEVHLNIYEQEIPKYLKLGTQLRLHKCSEAWINGKILWCLCHDVFEWIRVTWFIGIQCWDPIRFYLHSPAWFMYCRLVSHFQMILLPLFSKENFYYLIHLPYYRHVSSKISSHPQCKQNYYNYLFSVTRWNGLIQYCNLSAVN